MKFLKPSFKLSFVASMLSVSLPGHAAVWSKVVAGAILSTAGVMLLYLFGSLFSSPSALPEVIARQPAATNAPMTAPANPPTSAASASTAIAPSPTTNVQTGNCSPNIVGAKIDGSVLKDLVQEIQKSARRRGYSQMELARFVEGVNTLLGGFSRSLSSLAGASKPNGADFERKRIRVVLQLAAAFDRLIGASAGDAEQFRFLAQNWRDKFEALVAELDGKLPEDKFVKDALANEQDLDLAIEILNTLLVRQDSRLDAMALRNHQLGNVHLLKFDTDKALPFFLRAYQLMPASFDYARTYGVELFKAGKTVDSVGPLKQAPTIFNDLPPTQKPPIGALAEVRLATGAAYAKLGRQGEAEEVLKGAVALNSRATASDNSATYLTAAALIELAGIQIAKGNLELSTSALSEASDLVSAKLENEFLRFEPLKRQILILLSLLDTTAGQNKLAELRLKQALALEKRAVEDFGARNSAGRAEVLYHLGTHCGSNGRFVEAAEVAREAVGIYRDLRTRGAVLQHLQEFASSLTLQARMIVQIDPARALEAEVLAMEATTTLGKNLDSRDSAAAMVLLEQSIDLAEIQLISGNIEAADLLASNGVKTYRILTQLRVDKSDATGLARALQAAGNASSRLGRIQVADQYFTEAMAIVKTAGRSGPGYVRRKYIDLLRDVEKHYSSTRQLDLAARITAEIEELSPPRR